MMTPDQEANIVAMREAGYTINVIAERVDCSTATIKRVCTRHKASKGSATQEIMDEARAQLRRSISGNEAIQEMAASIVLDTKYHFELLREKLAEVANKIEINNADDAKAAARTLNSCANALKLSTDAMRSALKIDTSESFEEEELPILTVTAMTKEDIEAVLREHAEEEAELYGTDEEPDNTIVDLH